MKDPLIESRQEMEELLRQQELGYLGLCDDGGPYVVPLNYSYAEGKILFHCGLKGKKLDCIRANPQVCFTVARLASPVRLHPIAETCHVDCESVICFGRARVLEEIEERKVALNAFNRRFRPDAGDVPVERVRNCGMVEIAISHMTGRRERVQPKELVCWQYSFPG